MSGTTELRSIYSGPIRRGFDRLDSLTTQLSAKVAALEAALATAQADVAALRTRVDDLEGP